jgi:predicted nucleic acid-binding protein
LMLQAAERAGAQTVYSEDLSHGARYAGMHVVNPFIL